MPERRRRAEVFAGNRPVRQAMLFASVLALCALVAGCDKKSPPPQAAPGAPVTPPAAARGLLIARDEGIVLRDMESGAEQLLKPAVPATVYTYPRWSPDGTRIGYVVTTYATRVGDDSGSDIVVLTVDGGSERMVLKHEKPGERVEGLAWAAEGDALVISTLDQDVSGTLKIERLDLAGGKRTTLMGEAAYPTVSPDGRQVVYLTFSSGLEGGGLWIANVDGTDRRRLLSIPSLFAGVRQPRFSPDGKQLAFGAVQPADAAAAAPTCTAGRRWPWQPRIAAAHGPPITIWTMPVDGGAPRRVTSLVEDDPAVAWAPDGSRLAVIGACGLYELPLDGGEARKVGAGANFSQIDWR